jgi:hypothetical protein
MSKKHKIKTVGGDALTENPFTALDEVGFPESDKRPCAPLSQMKSAKKVRKVVLRYVARRQVGEERQ